jgi:uncharacterized protein YcbK (DUF882 family)
VNLSEWITSVKKKGLNFSWSWFFCRTGGNKKVSKYFSEAETFNLDQRLIDKLDRARGLAGIPFVITSGWRSPEENTTDGGVPDSSHCLGLAVDLRCQDGNSRFKMVTALIDAGFNRIGVYNLHIHCDVSDVLPQKVIWTGVSH